MGYNTTVFILNDAWSEAEKDPEGFVRKIGLHMNTGSDLGVGNHLNGFTVMPTEHADVMRLYVTHQNMILELSPYSKDLMKLAERMPTLVSDYIDAAQQQLDTLRKEVLPHLRKELKESVEKFLD